MLLLCTAPPSALLFFQPKYLTGKIMKMISLEIITFNLPENITIIRECARKQSFLNGSGFSEKSCTDPKRFCVEGF